MSMGSAAPAGAVDNVVARIERLPTSWWHVKTRIIVGVATFFDAFDAIAIATVLPVLVPMWKLTGPDIGFMISAGYVGQLIGALLFGWIGERYGRMPAMIGSIAMFAVMSLVCAFAWDYNSLLWFPHLARHRPRRRGAGRRDLHQRADAGEEPRPLRAALRAGVSDRARGGEPAPPLWVVPHLGWQWMFYIGALPAILALFLRVLLPESPRWLAVHGRNAEADAALSLIERETQKATGQPLPPVQPVVATTRPARVVVRPVRADLSAAHAGRVGDLVLRLFHQLRPGDLAADDLPHRVTSCRSTCRCATA